MENETVTNQAPAPENLQPEIRRRAAELFQKFTPAEREPFLIKTWMAHDARWFTELAKECGLETAQRINRRAAHELGKYEARRLARALPLPPVKTLQDFLLAQEVLIHFLGPELLQYDVLREGADSFRMDIRRCFAAENAVRGGLTETFQCGILERVTGWLEALRVDYQISPPIGRCMKCAGQECSYTLTLRFPAPQQARD